MSTRVLMLGWELPPFNSGGLGQACLDLSYALSKKGAAITFVLPKKLDIKADFMNIIFANVDERDLAFTPSYTTSLAWSKYFSSSEFPPLQDFVRGALKFAEKMEKIAKKMVGQFDVIHAHDWMTYPAAIVAKKILGIPLVVHVHSTEFDRTGGHFPNPLVYAIEKKGFDEASQVLPVGGFMKNVLVEKYGVIPEKVRTVYNGIDQEKKNLSPALTVFKDMGYKIVLFLGRITLQKGPEYFVRAAQIVSEFDPKVLFVVVGSGDMEGYMMTEAARLGILDKFIFTGFLRGDERDRMFQSADLFVMPSVSEPFGLVALESVVNGTPVLISKQSGVSEVLKNALKVDFWDVEEIANKILAVLVHGALGSDLKWESGKEVRFFNWARSADDVMDVYNQITIKN